jgi:predicted SAM-dependent methyltransferase
MSSLKRFATNLGKQVLRSQGVRNELRETAESVKRVAHLSMSHALGKRSLATIEGDGLLINLGAGALQDARWINVDIEPQDGAYFADLRDPLPLRDGSVRHIHCEHFLEHLEYYYAQKFLAECVRVLGAGGSMRIIVPDAEKYIRAYASGDSAFFERLRELGNPAEPFRTPIEIINQMFTMSGSHRFGWDFETLELAAREAGFARIERSQRNDVTPELCIDGSDWWREVESLYCNLHV